MKKYRKHRTFLFSALLLMMLTTCNVSAFSQAFLSNLKASAGDPIFTTYAAPPSRSDFKSDQGWELMWTNPLKPIGFISKDAGEAGIFFAKGQEVRINLATYFSSPVITKSYSDLVCFTSYPFRNLKVDAFYVVYSSTCIIQEYTFTNESMTGISFQVFPYMGSSVPVSEIQLTGTRFIFTHERKRDAWMIQHNIPYTEQFANLFSAGETPSSYGVYDNFPSKTDLLSEKLNLCAEAGRANYLFLRKDLVLAPGESRKIRVIRAMKPTEAASNLSSLHTEALQTDLVKLLTADENFYAKIPLLTDKSDLLTTSMYDLSLLYYSCFNLIRQCLMPPEGKCRQNYYVFSREPKWGWGYGGQVFHESLSMLAYVYMDPVGAMNSQRVFMERQLPSGYINYRTGPYLDETMGNQTCSGPFFSYINLNIYLETKDVKFLNEAYNCGQKLYHWFIKNRDKDGDMLLEWGGEAVLESLRDGLVDVWDNVSNPGNLEGPDLNSMMVQEAIALAIMAKELKLEDEYRSWLNTANRHAKVINNQLWDTETGFYYNTLLSTNGFSFLKENDLKIKDITGFLPLWANFCNKEQSKKLVETLTNPEEFWRPYGIPTLTAKSSYYNPMGYWNGPAWVQWEYLIFRGLLDYGYFPTAFQLAQKVVDQAVWNLKNDHTFWEFYSPDQRQAGWNRTYIWAGLTARFLIDLQTMQQSSKSDLSPK